MRPPKESTAEDRLELHREKMRNKAGRRERWHRDGIGWFARQLRQGKKIPPNASARPGGKKRTEPPRRSIWPASKIAKPGRMG